MTTATSVCPRCNNAIAAGSRFCASCGNDISGVWSQSNNAVLGGTIAVESDPAVDTLGAMLSEATLGEYQIYGQLGRGGMAAVYLGFDISLNRKVAIKTMLPELVAREGMVPRFIREAQTAAGLNHPHIIQIYAVKQTSTLVYFVMKFVEGRSLESVITDRGRIPIAMTQTILSQVGSALDFAHKKHVVHRDIKPANIMIDEDGWAIVTDFGIAKVQEARNLTATGTAIGTPHYMSPEQFHNKSITGASDQYSLGVVLYEMLTGKKPFDGATYAELITQHLFEPVPDIREFNADLPPHVVDVVKKMMAKDPAERFPDLDSAIHALGTPQSKSEGDAVRTQMRTIAKSGPQKRITISAAPLSPIPIGKGTRGVATAPTVIEGAAQKGGARKPAPEQKKSRTGLWIGIAAGLVLLSGGGYFALQTLNRVPVTPDASVTPAGGPETATSVATNSIVAPPVAQDTAKQEPAVPVIDSAKIRADSIAEARRVAQQKRRDSIALANRIKQQIADSIRIVEAERARVAPRNDVSRINTGPASAVSEQAAPQTASIRIASRTPGAVLYVNDQTRGFIPNVSEHSVPGGVNVRLQIRAPGCTNWDSTIVLTPGTVKGVGNKTLKCGS